MCMAKKASVAAPASGGFMSTVSKYKWPIAILLIILLLGSWVIGMYNGFVTLDQTVQSKWSSVENQYQRQYDLIPNLVSTVSSAVKVETKFITDVTNARSQWAAAKSTYDKDVAGVTMNNAITAFVNAVAVTENYPVLQANKQYVTLTDELIGTQNRIAVARNEYIVSIQAFNTAVLRFPANVFANMFGFGAKEYYKAAAAAMITPVLGTGTLP